MKHTSDLDELCKTLEKKEKESHKNRITLTREEVTNHIGNNMDRYLQLKAEMETVPGTADPLSQLFSMLAFALAAVSFSYSATSDTDKTFAFVSSFLTLAAIYLIALWMLNKWSPINKWQKYILAVLDECKPQLPPAGTPQKAPATTPTATPTQTQNPASN